jgi:hypothetical protein
MFGLADGDRLVLGLMDVSTHVAIRGRPISCQSLYLSVWLLLALVHGVCVALILLVSGEAPAPVSLNPSP